MKDYDNGAIEAHKRWLARQASADFQRDPINGPLSQFVANAEPMTPDLWDKLTRDFNGHAEKREATRARERRMGARPPRMLG